MWLRVRAGSWPGAAAASPAYQVRQPDPAGCHATRTKSAVHYARRSPVDSAFRICFEQGCTGPDFDVEASTDAALIVEILGHDADRYPALRHGDTVNSGANTIHTGRLTPSALVFNALP